MDRENRKTGSKKKKERERKMDREETKTDR